MSWGFWIGSSERTSHPQDRYPGELSTRGFQVTWGQTSTPRELFLTGRGITGVFALTVQNAPIEAIGERFVLALGITLKKPLDGGRGP